MITRVHIENFKSLVDFELPPKDQRLSHLTCLVGMNGAGKSTVLQALDFLSQLMSGKVTEWLAHREWVNIDLVSRIPREPQWLERGGKRYRIPFRLLTIIRFDLEFKLPSSGKTAIWSGKFNRTQLRCTWEEVRLEGHENPVLAHEDGVLRTRSDDNGPTVRETDDLLYQGSILSIFDIKEEACQYIKIVMQGLKSLEMLTPAAMRRRSRRGADIGYGGEQLSAFVASLRPTEIEHLTRSLGRFYPQVMSLGTTTARGGWKSLVGFEEFATILPITSKNMNDGMLRVIAILAQGFSKHPVLLFDEIENGINPELVEKLVDFLVGMNKQVVITTHSPMILNFMDDKVARESVYLLYRDDSGCTRSARFFDDPDTAAKLDALGPGEVFVDTNLTRLTKRLARRATKPKADKSDAS